MKWLPISELHEYINAREMFVVKAFNIPYTMIGGSYDSDPYCVWLNNYEAETPEHFSRWPHPFMPTHFCLLPTEK